MSEYNPLYLVKVEPGANNNKYYKMVPNGDNFEVQFGRIGNSGYQTSSYNISQWNKKLNEKIKKGYADLSHLVAETTIKKKKEYIDIKNSVIASIVNRLMTMAKQAIKDNYTISSSKVTQIMIDEAQVTLDNLATKDNLEGFNKALVELFKIIPRKMTKVSSHLANKIEDFGEIIQKEQDLLDVMRGQVVHASIEEDEIIGDQPSQTILDATGLFFEEVTTEEIGIIKKNLGDISDKFYQAWKVVNNKTQGKYDTFITQNDIKETKLLWHGSRNENWWSIINSGLALRPSAIITGKLYGHGIYFAPKARKSLGYTSLNGSYWSKGNSTSAFMSLYEIGYGNPYNVYDFNSKYYEFNWERLRQHSKDSDCLHAHAGASLGNSSLKNDEIIIYKEDQSTIKYLVELR